MGTLYIVPTPLGNLEDITLRALRILGEVLLIATEDTRTTGRLLKHYNIHSRMVSHHEHSRPAQLEQILTALDEGDVALVSEAGTPLLSDPGYELVRLAVQRGINVVSLPGPNAITTALAASGLPPYPFLFAGFLPRKATERRHFLQDLASQRATLVFFESPHRFQNALTDMAEILGAERSLVGSASGPLVLLSHSGVPSDHPRGSPLRVLLSRALRKRACSRRSIVLETSFRRVNQGPRVLVGVAVGKLIGFDGHVDIAQRCQGIRLEQLGRRVVLHQLLRCLS